MSCPAPTDTLQPALRRLVARVAGALVAANHVDTLAVPAQPVAQLAFVDICDRTEPSSMRGSSHGQHCHSTTSNVCTMVGLDMQVRTG